MANLEGVPSRRRIVRAVSNVTRVATVAIVIASTGDVARASGACESPRILVAGSLQYPDGERERWSIGEFLAYDLMTRTATNSVQQETVLAELTRAIDPAFNRLTSAFPEAFIFPNLEYEHLTLQVKLAAGATAQIAQLAPGKNHLRQIALPGPLSAEFSKFCEEICYCHFAPTADGGMCMYFPRSVNLVNACQRLRKFPDVESVSLLRRRSNQSSLSAAPTNLSVNRRDTDFYFTASVGKSGEESEKRFYVVTDFAASEVTAADAAMIPEFRLAPLPGCAWQ